MIKAIITDVDGVLTDGGMYWDSKGLAMKRFHTRDISAIHRLQAKGYKVFAITSASDDITRRRLEYSKLDSFIMADRDWIVFNKLSSAFLLADQYGFELSEAIYIGDDLMDIELMKACKLGICPEDAAIEVQEIADIILMVKGGHGVMSNLYSMIDHIEDYADAR